VTDQHDGEQRAKAGDGTDIKVAESSLDLPPSRLTRVVIVASLQRSGSSLLSALLDSTGCVGVPREYLNPDALSSASIAWGLPTQSVRGRLGQLRRRLRGDDDWQYRGLFTDQSIGTYLQALTDRRTTASGIFAMKVQWAQWSGAFLGTGQTLDLWNAPITWVRMTRTDEVAQAISLSRAQQNQEWSSAWKATRQAVYNETDIVRCINDTERCRIGWDRYFLSIGVEPYVVNYESLMESTSETVAGVMRWLGFPDVQPARPSTRRQAGTESEDWKQRFLKSYPEFKTRTI